MRNQLGQFEFVAAPTVQGRLELGGVEVSVRADLLVDFGTERGASHGCQDKTDEDALQRKKRWQVRDSINPMIGPVNRRCLTAVAAGSDPDHF
jgi:hypothetical protein